MSKKKKKNDKKKTYFLLYEGEKLIAIAKSDKVATAYVQERYGLNVKSIYNSFFDELSCEKKKLPEIAEEYEMFIREYKGSDIIESVREHRYRKLMMEEFKQYVKEQKKIYKEAKKKSIKNKLRDAGKHSAKEVKRYLNKVKKTAKEEMNFDEDREDEVRSISETIISDPNTVNEYLKSHEIIKMIRRGEI